MALTEFWNDVRSRNPLFHEGVSPPDVPRITSEDLDAELLKSQQWRTLGALKGYDRADFEFLDPADLGRLSNLVQDLNAIAPELRQCWYAKPRDETRLTELTDLARPLLGGIILLLQQDRYRTADALRYGKQVERELAITLPDQQFDLRFAVGNDWTGDRSFWVWVMLPLNIATDDGEQEFLQSLSDYRQPISDACRIAVPDLFAYVSFRTTETPREYDEEAEVQTAEGAA